MIAPLSRLTRPARGRHKAGPTEAQREAAREFCQYLLAMRGWMQ